LVFTYLKNWIIIEQNLMVDFDV